MGQHNDNDGLTMADPRSIRTNNPGAMNYGPFARANGAIGSDGRLAIFPDMETGFKAQENLLGTYETKHGLNTVRGIINRWAPPNVDNNSTDQYTQFVASRLGVSPDSPLTPDLRPRLAEVMAHYEAGRPVSRTASTVPPVPTSTLSAGAPSMAVPYTDNGWTPESVDSGRRLGRSLMKQGMDSSPVGHWTQALARVMQTGVGTAWDTQANTAESEGKRQVGDFYSRALQQQMTPQQLTGGLARLPFGRDDAQGFAKAIIAQQLKGPELTEAQKNFAYGQRNPDFARREIELKQAGRPQTTVDMRAENSAAQEVGKGAGKAEVEAYDQARSAGQQLQQLAGLQARLERLKTGPTAPIVRNLAMWARDLGVSPDTLKVFGIPENFVGDANSFEAATAGMLVNKLGSGGFPSNNFSNADREFLEKTLPRLGTDPRGNRIMIEAAKRVEQSKIEKARAYQQWKADPSNKGKNFYDFDMDYAGRVGNRFDDLVQEARQMLDAAGQGFQPQATRPGQAPPQQNGGGGQVIEGARRMVPPAAIDMLRQNPGTAAQFDEIFGPGAAASVLGQGQPQPTIPPPPAPAQRRGTPSREVLRNG